MSESNVHASGKIPMQEIAALPPEKARALMVGICGIANIATVGQPSPLALLEEARQLLVTAANAGEYGKGDDWAKRYEAWQETVRVLGVKG